MTSKPNTTQAALVRRGIEQSIFNGDLAPGTAIEEGRLASVYGVSRTPVREAIANLVQVGLLTKLAHRRAVVSQLDPGNLLELFEALAEMEGLAAKLATIRMSPSEITALLDIHNQAADILNTDGDINDYAALGERFHQSVLEGCRNRVLIEATAALSVRVYPYRRYQIAVPERLQGNQRDHQVIVDAITSGDSGAAYDAMRGHTAEQGDALVRFILLNKASYKELHRSPGVIGAAEPRIAV